ncbi:hypothetical protein F4604DRAFT_1533592, partial [Suillus subluteus]
LREKSVIPVLLGDSIHRPDRSEEEYEKYCCAMMILFKSWRDLSVLKGTYSSWSEAFDNETFTPEFLNLIHNMNIENECKDARDVHAATVREEKAKPHIF